MLQQLDAVHLPRPEEMLARYPHELSGGQCQRVLIAMAFCANPALIVADEPTTALDVVSQVNVLRLLAEQRRQHETAMLLITHDLRLAAHVCDDIAVLYAGEQVECGPAHEVLRRSRHPYTAALDQATPDVHGPQRPLAALRGQMPGISALGAITGCRFASRCSRRTTSCEVEPPEPIESAPGHVVRCVWPLETADVPREAASGNHAAWPVPDGETSATPLIELREATLRYTARRGLFGQRKVHTTAVDGLSLKIQPGEFVCVVGPSGCGKTTLLGMIAGLERPRAGSVALDGQPVRSTSPDVAYMLARDALLPWFTARENVELGLRVRGVDKAERRRRSNEWLQRVGLAEFEGSSILRLSQGMRQRVAIARTLAMSPKCILMDEPFAALDAQTRVLIQQEFVDLWARDRQTVVFVTHDLSEAITLADRIVVMTRRPGRIKLIYDVQLPRPRDVIRLRETAEYSREYGEIWHALGEEFRPVPT